MIIITYVSILFILRMVSCHLEQTIQVSSFPVGYKEHGSEPRMDLNRVDPCLVLVCCANCDFRCLVPANVVAAMSKGVSIL